MQPCVGLSLYKLIQEDPGQKSPSLESERMVGAGRWGVEGIGVWDIMRGVEF